ncbi:hypothetical protein FACS1894176_06320 [Bacteroidia bacterium]|nr:hypothetical protein FACS1894176_06320 [Bacteroidia bacterium]
MLDRSQARKGIEMCGYVQEIYQEKKQILLSVRPWLHCPDIDEVDDISLEQVVSCEDEEVGIGSKVKYVV